MIRQNVHDQTKSLGSRWPWNPAPAFILFVNIFENNYKRTTMQIIITNVTTSSCTSVGLYMSSPDISQPFRNMDTVFKQMIFVTFVQSATQNNVFSAVSK